MTIRTIALVGVGKIARDQHIPQIAAHPAFQLTAAASRNATVEGVANYRTVEALLESEPAIDAVSLCMPPKHRMRAALMAIEAGCATLLEKPPGATLAEVESLTEAATAHNVTLYASWHSREADAVAPAAAFLKHATIHHAQITWKEDVYHWHPGQEWIWEPGGGGVFDMGVNALSIATAILPHPIHLTEGTLDIPENAATPVAASLNFQDTTGATVAAELDWLQSGEQTWQIEVESSAGHVLLSAGGASLAIDGVAQPLDHRAEYARVYDRFDGLISLGAHDVDVAPMRLVADSMMVASRRVVAPVRRG